MTGRELAIYILQNNLEDETVFTKDFFTKGFLTIEEIAAKLGVGPETIGYWSRLGHLHGLVYNSVIYFRKDFVDPRETISKLNKKTENNDE